MFIELTTSVNKRSLNIEISLCSKNIKKNVLKLFNKYKKKESKIHSPMMHSLLRTQPPGRIQLQQRRCHSLAVHHVV